MPVVPVLHSVGFLPTHELSLYPPYLMPVVFGRRGLVAGVLLVLVVLVLLLLEIAVDMPPNLLDIVPNPYYSREVSQVLADKTDACLLDY
jgi:hypothetical protein